MRRSLTAIAVAIGLLVCTDTTQAYPLDGFENTGIRRLWVQRMIQEGKIPGKKRPPGELLPLDKVDLRLVDYPNFELPPIDPELTKKVVKLLGVHADRYGIGLLDLSDMQHPRYAEWNGHMHQNPGSVGKLMVALAFFQGLADAHPNDIEARKRILRDTIITADIFSVYDFHTVPVWVPETRTLVRHPIQVGQKASLYTYLDWMLSPSSNSAAGMIEKQVILLSVFGKDYPPSPAAEAKFFSETSRSELGKIFLKAIEEPITRNGLNLKELRQGSFFTHEGKKKVPGTNSYATARELMNYMVKMEQGKLVDRFSSLEIKRLIYITERRIRYASSGSLRKSAVYFKSGSLYSCEPEPGFTCTKYHGNKRNYMNSTAIVESPAGQGRLYYMTTVLSNVLRMNSAQDHRDLARAIQAMLLVDHPKKKLAPGEKPASLTYGEGFIGYQSERQSVLLAVDTQEALLALGYDIGDIDGAVGKRTRGAIRTFQKSQGLNASGKPSEDLVKTMRRVAAEKGLARPTAGD